MHLPGSLIVLLACLVGNASLAQSVTFAAGAPIAGSSARVLSTSSLTIAGDDGGTVTTSLDKVVAIMGVRSGRVTQVKVQYDANHRTSSLPRVEGERSPTEGRSYLAFADGSVTTPSGGKVSRAERQAVADDLRVGEPDPLTVALDGRTLTVGAALPSDAFVAMLDGGGASSSLGAIERAAARLIDVREQGSAQLAVFEIEVATKMKRGLRAETTIELTGEMIVAAPAGVMLSLDLSGPVAVVSQKRIRPMRRARTKEETSGTFDLTIRVTPEEQAQEGQSGEHGSTSTPDIEQQEPTTEQPVASIVGTWQTNQPGNLVEILAVGDVFQGTLSESSNPSAPLGTLILRDCVQTDAGYAGKLYSPKNDRLVDADLVVKGDTMTIKAKAGRRSRTIVWTRVH